LRAKNSYSVIQGPVGVSKKKGCDWILVSHDPVDPEKAWLSLQDFHSPGAEDKPDADVESAGLEERGVVTLKFEPFILHVQCRDTESAKLLHTQRYNYFSYMLI
jgi:tRNA(Phe) wybutosine-synthesizing methylase Tyw3